MFEDYLDIEMRYVKETGIYPIMHTIAIKREIVEANPWVAASLFKAFDRPGERSVERALSPTTSSTCRCRGATSSPSACRTSSART